MIPGKLCGHVRQWSQRSGLQAGVIGWRKFPLAASYSVLAATSAEGRALQLLTRLSARSRLRRLC